MSRSIDLFIDSDRPIEEVAAEITRLTRITLSPGESEGTWTLDEGEVHAELHAHPYLDDGDLLLEHYRYALSCRVSIGTRLIDASETTLLRLVSEALQQGGLPTLLVHDLQYRDRLMAATGPNPSPAASGPNPSPAAAPESPVAPEARANGTGRAK